MHYGKILLLGADLGECSEIAQRLLRQTASLNWSPVYDQLLGLLDIWETLQQKEKHG